MAAYFKEEIHEIDETEEHGFFFFNRKFRRTSEIKNLGVNFFDYLEEEMVEKEIRYMAVFQFKDGNRNLKLYSIESGQIRPAFYEYIPRS